MLIINIMLNTLLEVNPRLLEGYFIHLLLSLFEDVMKRLQTY